MIPAAFARSIRVVTIFVLAAAVAVSGALLGPLPPVVAAEVELEPTDIAPLKSSDLTTFLGGAEPVALKPAPGVPLDESALDEQDVALPKLSTEKFDIDRATLIGRDELTDRYRDELGRKWAVISPNPKNAIDKSTGEFAPLSESIKLVSEGAISNRHPLNPSFSAEGDDSSLMSVERKGFTLDVTLVNAIDVPLSSNATARRLADEVEYKGILPDVDLAVQLDGSSLTEQLILDTAPKSAPAWRWTYKAPGLKISQNEFEDVEFAAPDGEVIFSIPTPVMWDSSGVEGKRSASFENVDTLVVPIRDGVSLTLMPSMKWLTSKDRVYPVHVDPTLGSGQTNLHSYRSDGGTRLDRAWVGNSRDGGDKYWRAIAFYDYSAVSGKHVVNAQHDVAWADGVQASVGGGVVNHAACLGYNCIGAQLGTFGLSNGVTTTVDGGLGQQYATWASQGAFGAYLMMRYAEAPGQYTFKGLNSALYLQYEDFPAITGIAAPTPGNGSGNASISPVLKATASDPAATGVLQYYYRVWNNAQLTGVPVFQSSDYGAQAQQLPQGHLSGGTQYWWRAYVRDGWHGRYGISTQRESGVFTFTTGMPAPAPDPATVVPADEAIVATLTPTLGGTSHPTAPANTKYQFRITTGTDGVTGAIISSDWLTTPSWTVPEGVLQDGGQYRWRIATDNGIDKVNSSWLRRLQVNLRLGTSGPSPKDSIGPVTVNLANGNASLNFSSPTVETVGGPIGESFAYNSRAVRADGLTARYYDAIPVGGGAASFDFAGKLPLLTRTDPGIDFDWATGAPGPSVPADNFLARWTGFVNLPAGSYTFGVTRDDGARVWINGTQVINQWVNGSAATGTEVQAGSTISLPGGPVSFQAETYDQGGPASFSLHSKLGSNPFVKVPATAYTKTFESLPAGWGASTALAGEAGAFSRAEVTSGAVILTDSTGTAHTYAKKAEGGYSPPTGEYGTVALDAAGKVSFTDEGGTIYLFDGAGRVSSVSSPAEVVKPANPMPVYRPGTGQINAISDPLSSNGASPAVYARSVTFAYGGDLWSRAGLGLTATDSDASNTACPARPGFFAAPNGMLCRIVYPGHVPGGDDTTELLYNGAGQFTRIIDPGQEVTDFSYDSAGRMTTIRDSLANDWLAFSGTVPSASQTTEIAYDAAGRVSKVTLPAADKLTAGTRSFKTYDYDSGGAGTTFVDASGITPPTAAPANGHAATVTYDANLRQLTARSASGLLSSQTWSAEDQVLSAVDPVGRMTTTIYDPTTDRPTDSYGPAPTSCFDVNRVPLASCAIVPARSTTRYDEGMQGLNVAWFKNASLAGSPDAFTLGLPGATGGSLLRDWSTGGPGIAGFPVDNFSARLTGYLQFPVAGVYTFQFNSDDIARLWVDDALALSQLAPGTSGGSVQITATAGQRARIRLDFQEMTSAAYLDLRWKMPGSASYVTVPGTQLTPDYGLTTSTKTEDSAPTGVAGVTAGQVASLSSSGTYGSSPWLGLLAESAVDPAGLNLRTAMTYNGNLQRATRALPAQVATGGPAKVSTYWGGNDTLTTSTCGLPVGTRQNGFLKQVTSPAPASGTAVTADFVYDNLGRTVGVKRGAEGWSCTTYDARWRPVTVSTPAFGVAPNDTPASTSTTWYTSDGTATGNPLVQVEKISTTPGSVTTTTDLLGRTLSYTDTWGTVAATTYENLTGRVLEMSVTTPGLAAKAMQYSYDVDGRVTLVKDAGKPIAVLSYLSGELVSETHPSGTGNAGNGSAYTDLSRNGAGALTGASWTFPSAPTLREEVVRSQSGRIVKGTVTRGGTVNTSLYSYDAAGRLVQATIPRHQLSYSYAASGGCGASVAAGSSGNRTSSVDVKDGGAPTSTSYCFDNADRLTSSTVANPVAGAGPVADGLAPAELAYDGHGNTVRLADQTLVYDAADQHVRTVLADGTRISYDRDFSGRLVQRKQERAGEPTEVQRYTYIADGDAPWGMLNVANARTQRTIALPSGAQVFVDGVGSQFWHYPNIHGDIVLDGAGTGTLRSFDPFGQPVDPATGQIGTVVADDAVFDTTPGGADRGWVGQHGKTYEHAGTVATIEMGARQYVPALGRFLGVDAVPDANANDYSYPIDPINMSDLTGLDPRPGHKKTPKQVAAARVAAAKVATVKRQVARAATVRTQAKANLPMTVIGLSIGLRFGNCESGGGGLIVCGGMGRVMPRGSGVTIGNTVLTTGPASIATSNTAFMQHEGAHAKQWAHLGPSGFLSLWGSGLAISMLTGNYQSGGGGCLNVLEYGAGAYGGYRRCGW